MTLDMFLWRLLFPPELTWDVLRSLIDSEAQLLYILGAALGSLQFAVIASGLSNNLFEDTKCIYSSGDKKRSSFKKELFYATYYILLLELSLNQLFNRFQE